MKHRFRTLLRFDYKYFSECVKKEFVIFKILIYVSDVYT